MSAQPSSFLGKGWCFPPSFQVNGNLVDMVSGEGDIQQSMQIILSTANGERVMLGDFGCNLNQFLYEEIDQSLANGIAEAVKDGLLKYEARIDVENVDVDVSDGEAGLVLINITYQVRMTNSRFNMVYPFYINEGSPL
ncbi:MAG: GPW/gp25 family protein [Candidatus Methylumidiphilus sp.]